MAVKEKKTAKEKKKEAPKESKEKETVKATEVKAPEEAKKPEKAEGKEKKKETAISKTYVIPLSDVFRGYRTLRAKRGSKLIKEFLKKHTKAEVKVDPEINELLHSKGKGSIPRRIKVSVINEAGKATATLAK